MQITLFDWAPSPFSLKVRAVLEHKGLAYARKPVLQPANWLDLRRRGRIGKAPALDIDGRLFVDSTDIAHELERRFPSRRILPSDPRERALCHAIEEWADESLYFVGLYYQWQEPDGRRMVPQVFGRTLLGRLAYRFYLRRILNQVRGQGTGRKTPPHVLSDLDRHLDAIENLLAPGPFLLGEEPYLCDFAVFGQLTYLGRTPVGAKRLTARPRIQGYVAAMKGHREAPAGAVTGAAR